MPRRQVNPNQSRQALWSAKRKKTLITSGAGFAAGSCPLWDGVPCSARPSAASSVFADNDKSEKQMTNAL